MLKTRRPVFDEGANVRLINAGFWAARALSSAVEVGLVGAMGDGVKDPCQVAESCGISPRGAEVLLRFLNAFGFADEVEGGYRLTRASRELWLSEPSPFRTEGLIDHGVWASMEKLTGALAHGSLPSSERYFDGLDSGQVASFTATMEVGARRFGPQLVETVDLAGRARLLDLGGGSGLVASLFARSAPATEVVVLERPQVLDCIEPATRRDLRLVSGDMWCTDPALGHDVLLLSRVLHDWDDTRAAALVDRWVAPMPAGGLVIVCEQMADSEDGPGRRWAALLDVFLFASLGQGRVRTRAEVGSLLATAGCGPVSHHVLPEGSTVSVAEKL